MTCTSFSFFNILFNTSSPSCSTTKDTVKFSTSFFSKHKSLLKKLSRNSCTQKNVGE
ncbi:hypothetical protein SAL_1972 [Streptococcus agalactiae 515]|nr:hypothetical protein SAL_1972 [Streptococcus agalactiae 515]